MKRRLILGPPGTGKTTRLLQIAEDWIAHGVDPGRLGFATFTREARRVAIGRFVEAGIPAGELTHCRTIHSAMARALALSRSQYVTEKDLSDFSKAFGYRLTGGTTDLDDDPAPRPGTDDGRLLAWLELGRARCQTDEETADQIEHYHERRAFVLFAKRYRAWLRDIEKYDYTAILETAIRQGVRLPVSHLIIDEAQDLSPLQIAAMAPTIDAPGTMEVVVAGDDDQAIFGFAGSSPDWLMWLSKRWSTRILEQSWRVPKAIHKRAQAIIERNHERVPKTYKPTEEEGSIGWLRRDDIARYTEPGTLCVARTRYAVGHIAGQLHDARIPYLTERGSGPNPLGRPKTLRAIEAAALVAQGEPVDAADLSVVLDMLPSSRRPGALCPWGVKTRVNDIAGEVTRSELVGLGLDPLAQALTQDHIEPLAKVPPMDRLYYRDLWKTHGKIPRPQVRLSTVHGVKGREADRVILCPSLPKVVEMERRTGSFEAENRIAYVALTRAKHSVGILDPVGRWWFEY